MVKTPRTKAAGERQVLVHYDQALPEIPDRLPHELPSSYLEKDGKGGYRIVPGRRPSKLLLVPKIRQVVDAWRTNGYNGASDTSQRLLEYWFGSGHRLKDGREFLYYFGQREAIETLIYLHEVEGLTDAADLILGYMDEAAYGNDIFVTRKQIVEDIRGKRRLQRLVPDTGQMADQAIPPEKLPRYAIKMATGSGKTVVMALAVAWSYFHRRFEQGSTPARHFLLLAPNIIVYERLKTDFENETVFGDLPIIPPEWRQEWDFRTVLRGEPYSDSAWGALYLTNIQQLYDRSDDEPINPIDMVLGPRVKTDGTAKSASILDMVQEHDDLIIINDEAHHVHDEELEWWRVIEDLHKRLVKRTGGGLIAQLDFTATPKDRNGTFFPWIVSDYPLAQAVEDRIVKAPLVIHQTERADPQTYSNAAVAYQEWIQIGLSRWREHRPQPLAGTPARVQAYRNQIGSLCQAEHTRDADAIAEYFRREPDVKDEEVLVIHVKERGSGRGEITELDLVKARVAARSIDLPTNKIKVVVSVLMLREGWDVRNVTVILGLRPFTSDANILPEQAVGRGLRLMRDMHPDYAQVVEIVGTPKFEEFVKSLEIEGVGVGSTKAPPSPGIPIYPMKERATYDIEMPQLSQTYSRNYKDMASFDINTLPTAVVPLKGSLTSATEIEIGHGLTEVTVAKRTVDFQPDGVFLQDVLERDPHSETRLQVCRHISCGREVRRRAVLRRNGRSE
jgi:type III restriction enzyme